MNIKRIRVLFVDDESLAVVDVLKQEGYDVDHWTDVESLEKLSDGRYQVVFLDVRGIGSKHGGTGLDVLKYVATHNPLIYRIVFSAKPFTASENEITRRYSDRVMTKDCTAYEIIETLEEYANSLTSKAVLQSLEKNVRLNWYMKYRIKKGWALTESQLRKLVSHTSTASEGAKVAANVTTIAAALMKLITASA